MASKSKLDIPRHITYWKRCLKTYLPPQYTSMDANRMMIAYFTFLALDLLDALSTTISDPAERQNCLDWVYLCQHREGGFRGSPGTVDLDLNVEGREVVEGNEAWDSASVPVTFFALSILAILKDDFARVRRKECLTWLRKLQRPDGSFGEHLGEDGVVEGGNDTRFGFCAAGIRWMLRDDAEGDVEGVPDIEVDKLIMCIRAAQTFDGGISEMPFHEPHGGYTYCAIAALSLVGGLPKETQSQSTASSHHHNNGSNGVQHSQRQRPTGLTNIDYTTRWLLSRQTPDLGIDEENESDDEIVEDEHEIRRAGFHGRCNKPADTCYSFWISGSLALLGNLHLQNSKLSRDYLVEKTQHVIGGFGKKVGDPPDIYHSALGLAALSLVGEEGIKPLDARLCLSREAVAWVESLEWRKEIEEKSRRDAHVDL